MKSPVNYINPTNARDLPGLYSHAAYMTSGDLVFLSGQVAADNAGRIVGEGDVGAQLAATMQTISDLLTEFGSDLSSVVKFTTYLVNDSHIAEFNAARNVLFPTLFPGPTYPPNTLLIVSGLAKPEYLIEIDAIARCDSTGSKAHS